MSRARNLADLLDANGDVASGALDNVPPSNDASALTTGTLPIARIADGDVTAAKLASTLDLSGKTVTLPAGTGGKVLQVITDTVTAPSSISPGTTFTNYTDLAATITPSSTSSKIFVSAYCTWAASGTNQDVMIRISRNGSGVFIGDARNSNTRATHGQGDAVDKVHTVWGSVLFSTAFLDSPSSTSAQTYSIQFATGFAQGGAIYLGQQGVGSGATSGEQNTAPASIVLMEIAA